MSRPYHSFMVKKHKGIKTDSELEEIRERYKNGVSEEIIDHMADKIAFEFMGLDNIPKMQKLQDIPKGSQE